LLAGFHLSGCGRKSETPRAASSDSSSGSSAEGITVNGVESTYRDSQGRILWRVKAKTGGAKIEAMRVDLQSVDCTMYADDQPSWRCLADHLTADKPADEIRMSGHVSGKSVDGQRAFFAPEIVWNIKTGEITGGLGVTMRTGPMELNGDRLEANSANKKGRVYGHVRGRIVPVGAAKEEKTKR
jgi:hypothetical protein